jgi:hypothetical protein
MYNTDNIQEKMSGLHKAAIASAHRGTHQSPDTKKKISKSLSGKKSNHSGKVHDDEAKNRISNSRGHYDPIKGKSWVVNSGDKTYRKDSAPEGYKLHKRKYEEMLTFKDFLD